MLSFILSHFGGEPIYYINILQTIDFLKSFGGEL